MVQALELGSRVIVQQASFLGICIFSALLMTGDQENNIKNKNRKKTFETMMSFSVQTLGE
jgi:hypothetical protein